MEWKREDILGNRLRPGKQRHHNTRLHHYAILNSRSGGMVFSQGGGEDSSFPGLKHDTGLSVEWSIEEQYRLEEGLAKYANEPTIMKYIKIAASLCDKTVRDVALRCKWMAGKRRKHEDQNCCWKKDKAYKKDLLSMENGVSSFLVPATTTHDWCNPMLSGVIDGPTKHLLQENSQAFGQISSNLAALKLQQNIDLFFRAKQNLSKMLNDMSNMPGIMSRMPPLPVFINDELANSIFVSTLSSQGEIFSSRMTTTLKQEPGC